MSEEIRNEQAQEWLDVATAEAEKFIGEPSKVDEILMQVENKLREVPAIGETLADLPLMISMVKAWVKKEYTVVSIKVIACMVGSFIYLVNRRDLIPDAIPVLGIADDLAVLGLALKLSEPELKAFAAWRAAKNGQTQA